MVIKDFIDTELTQSSKAYYIKDVTEGKSLLSLNDIKVLLKELIKEKRISETEQVRELMWHIQGLYNFKYHNNDTRTN